MTEIHYAVTIGMRFKLQDVHTLRHFAKHHPGESERKAFHQAARACAKQELLVIQAMNQDALQRIMAGFIQSGVTPTFEDMRVSPPAGSAKLTGFTTSR